MFGLTDSSNRPRRRKKKKAHLEFDFEDAIINPPDRETEANEDFTRKREAGSKPESAQTDSKTFDPSNREEKETMGNEIKTRPSRINTADSIKRQKREQRAVSSVISGVGLAFTCGILMVAALASLGGYVLYKQLRDQSATIALLEQNTKQRFFEVETDLIKRDTELAKNLEQTNLRLMNVTSSFEEYRSRTTEMLADLRSTNKALERQLNQAKRENAEHRMQIARLENSVRLGGR